MDTLIIAPTHTYKKDLAQIVTNDTIKDQTDAVNFVQKIVAIIPKAPTKKAPDQTNFKSYQDMRAIHKTNNDANSYGERIFREREKTKRMNMTYYPNTDCTTNSIYIHGINNRD